MHMKHFEPEASPPRCWVAERDPGSATRQHGLESYPATPFYVQQLQAQVFLGFGFWNICIYIMRYLGEWDQSLNTEFIYVSYALYTFSLKVILYNISSNFMHSIKFHGVEFATCGVI